MEGLKRAINNTIKREQDISLLRVELIVVKQ